VVEIEHAMVSIFAFKRVNVLAAGVLDVNTRRSSVTEARLKERGQAVQKIRPDMKSCLNNPAKFRRDPNDIRLIALRQQFKLHCDAS
jgi:hypothetical protein